MDANEKLVWASLAEFVASLGAQVRAALAVGVNRDSAAKEGEQHVDPDFEGWLHSDPMVTGRAASRYGAHAPGYLTSNGRGSLEVGAAED
ncbi:MAG: hypothetical protein MUF80_04630 [Burkholderiales bacterium]|jgi:hypothetical protein|nr:hypothetical protein [Burkholderiales bacterium]